MSPMWLLSFTMAKTHSNNPVFSNPRLAAAVFNSARHPTAWLVVGRRLRLSASAIFEHEDPIATRFWDEVTRRGEISVNGKSVTEEWDDARFPVPNLDAAFMLTGFAIENLLKGLIVAKGGVTFNKQKLPRVLGTHKLNRLQDLAAPAVTIPKYVLDFLTYYSEWRGRYPMPLSVEQFWPMDNHGMLTVVGYSWPSSKLEMLNYCDALEHELRGLTK